MSTGQIWRRLAKVEALVCPKRENGGFTLEELCHAIWREDEQAFRKMAGEHGSLRYFIQQFEREGRGGR